MLSPTRSHIRKMISTSSTGATLTTAIGALSISPDVTIGCTHSCCTLRPQDSQDDLVSHIPTKSTSPLHATRVRSLSSASSGGTSPYPGEGDGKPNVGIKLSKLGNYVPNSLVAKERDDKGK